jgi:hypothetical protein
MAYSSPNSCKPGDTVLVSGLYAVILPSGGRNGLEVTCVKDEVFPPAIGAGYTYLLLRATKHKD